MSRIVQHAELDRRFSSEGAVAVPWERGQKALEQAEVYWLTTVRADGRPHVTPLIGIWLDDAFHFTTGPEEQKAKNLERQVHVAVTTGCNALGEGFDVVVEGDAERVTDEGRLQQLADLYKSKYGWEFRVRDGAFDNGEQLALVFVVAPTKAFGFGKGEPYSQTRWRFSR